MDFVFKILPTEIEDDIVKRVQYKNNFKKVIQDINKIGQVIDYEYNDQNIDNEKKQFEESDIYWTCLLDALEDIEVKEYHFQTPDNRVESKEYADCYQGFQDFYDNVKNFYHPNKFRLIPNPY